MLLWFGKAQKVCDIWLFSGKNTRLGLGKGHQCLIKFIHRENMDKFRKTCSGLVKVTCAWKGSGHLFNSSGKKKKANMIYIARTLKHCTSFFTALVY